MLINKYVNFRNPPPAPLALKGKRQLRFTQSIELALGCTEYFAKTKKTKILWTMHPSPKRQKTTRLFTTKCISTKVSVRTEFNTKLVQWNEKTSSDDIVVFVRTNTQCELQLLRNLFPSSCLKLGNLETTGSRWYPYIYHYKNI